MSQQGIYCYYQGAYEEASQEGGTLDGGEESVLGDSQSAPCQACQEAALKPLYEHPHCGDQEGLVDGFWIYARVDYAEEHNGQSHQRAESKPCREDYGYTLSGAEAHEVEGV